MHKNEAAPIAVTRIWNSGRLASLRSLLWLDREQTGAVLSVFLGAGLIIAPVPVWALLYYIFALPFCVIILLRNHVLLTREPGTVLATALIVWFTSGVIWDRSSGANLHTDLLWLWDGVCTFVFVRVSLYFFGRFTAERERLIHILIWCVIVNSCWSIFRFVVASGMDGRMGGWGITKHPILGASIIGVGVLLAVSHFISGRQRLVCLISIISGLAFIWLTGSRGPLIAVTLSLFVLVAFWRWSAAAALAVVILVLFGVASATCRNCIADVWAHLADRGWSSRLEIWQMTIDQVVQRPLLGYGPSAVLPRSIDNFPHNLFLSTVFYSGFVGLTLLVAMLGHGLWRIRLVSDRLARATGVALVLYIVLSGMTDLSAITKGPSPIWYIVWLPWILSYSRD